MDEETMPLQTGTATWANIQTQTVCVGRHCQQHQQKSNDEVCLDRDSGLRRDPPSPSYTNTVILEAWKGDESFSFCYPVPLENEILH